MPELGPELLSQGLVLLVMAGVPIALLTLTSFAKIAVVLSVLKNALGAGDVPSAPIVLSLSLALSAYVMSPVAAQTLEAFDTHRSGSPRELWQAASAPLRGFLLRHAGEPELAMFRDIASEQGRAAAPDDLALLWPSFALSELTRGLRVGLVVFLPFLVLDLVVAAGLLSLGLNGLVPHLVALPFKLLLFVSVDGVQLLSRALVLSYS